MNPDIRNPLGIQHTVIHYPSLVSLKDAHGLLLRRHRSGETEQILGEIETFICQGAATGALLDMSEERSTAQSLLDYWVTVLYRSGSTPPDAVLVEFDPSLSPELDEASCPYVGLSAFKEEKKEFFFGRHNLLGKMLDRLRSVRLLAVIGPSGSGKSSAALAGLVPLLKSGALTASDTWPASDTWQYFPTMVPGSDPLRGLALALKSENRCADDWVQQQTLGFKKSPEHLAHLINHRNPSPVVIVIDQFEEVFTLCSNDEARNAFVNNIVNLAQTPAARHLVVLTMRTDFESRIVQLPVLEPLFREGEIRVTPLNAAELLEAIEEPAKKVGLRFEEGIVESLGKEIFGEPAGLPLLQFALLGLWKRRKGNRITWSAYKALGGARQALAVTADKRYRSLIPEEQVTAKRILLRLARPTEGLEITSNRIRKESLSGEARDRIDRVLDKLIDAGLVRLTKGDTKADDQLEVAHEALIRNWPTLVGWLEDERAALRQRLRLTTAAEYWLAHGKDPGGLLGGSLLDEALGYEDLNEQEFQFVEASQKSLEEAKREKELAYQREVKQAQAVAEAERQRAEGQARAATRLRKYVASLIVASVIALVATFTAIKQERRVEVERDNAVEQKGIADKKTTEVKILNEELREAKDEEKRKASLADAAANREKIARHEAERLRLVSLAQALGAQAQPLHDEVGALLARQAYLFNLRGQRQILDQVDSALRAALSAPFFNRIISHLNLPVRTVAFSPDGQRLAAGGDDHAIWLWDLRQAGSAPTVLRGPSGSINSVAFSPDGQVLAAGSSDGAVRLWDLRQPSAAPVILNDPGGMIGGVYSVAFNSDRQLAATDSRSASVRLWNLHERSVPPTVLQCGPETGLRSLIRSITFSRDGQRLAAGCADGTVRLWNMQQPKADPIVLGSLLKSIRSVAFSPDGQRLAAGGGDGIRQWDLRQSGSGPSTRSPTRSASVSFVSSVAFSPDGQVLAAGSGDGAVLLWDLRQPSAAPIVLPGSQVQVNQVNSVAFSPDGQGLAVGSEDNVVRLWDLSQPGIRPTVLGGSRDLLIAASLSPDGQRLATYGLMGKVIRVWDLGQRGSDPIAQYGPFDFVVKFAFSPDSQRLAAGGVEGVVHVWDLRQPLTVDPTILRGSGDAVWSVAFSRKGQQLAGGSKDGSLWLWDLRQPEANPVLLPGPKRGVTAIAFSQDGMWLAAGSEDNNVWLWNLSHRGDRSTPTVLSGSERWINSVEFSPNSRWLAAGGKDGRVRLWDLRHRAAVPIVLRGSGGSVRSLVFSQNGQRLAAGSSDRSVRLWSLDQPNGAPIVLRGLQDGVWSVAFSPDGQQLTAADSENTVFSWPRIEIVANSVCKKVWRNLTQDEWIQFVGPGIPYERTCPNLP